MTEYVMITMFFDCLIKARLVQVCPRHSPRTPLSRGFTATSPANAPCASSKSYNIFILGICFVRPNAQLFFAAFHAIGIKGIILHATAPVVWHQEMGTSTPQQFKDHLMGLLGMLNFFFTVHIVFAVSAHPICPAPTQQGEEGAGGIYIFHHPVNLVVTNQIFPNPGTARPSWVFCISLDIALDLSICRCALMSPILPYFPLTFQKAQRSKHSPPSSSENIIFLLSC